MNTPLPPDETNIQRQGDVSDVISELDLKKSDYMLQATLDALSSHIAVLNEQGNIIIVNKAWQKFAEENKGLTIACGIGTNYIDVCRKAEGNCAQETASVAQGIADVMENRQTTFALEYPCHSPTEQRWFNVSVTRFSGDGPMRVVVAHENISGRKRNEDAIRINEERLRFITDNARVGLVMLDEERRYTFANATYAQILGLPSSNIVGLPVADVLAPVYETQIKPRLDRAFAGERVAYELHFPGQDGDRFFMVKYEPTTVDGFVSLVIVVITDITERKQTEELLREGESRVAGIVNAAMDAIITIDETQRIILFNPSAERMFRCSRSFVLGQSIERLIPERFRAAHGEHIRLFGQKGMTSRKMGALGALSGLRADGEEFPIEASISQIEIAGQKLFTVILRDITERKHAESALLQAHDELEKRVEERTSELQRVNETLRIEGIERKMAMDALRQSSEALHEAQQMLRLVLNQIPQAIFWKDRNSVYLGCNYRLTLDAGYISPEELIGKSDRQMPWSQYAADYVADDKQVMEMDTPKLNIEEPLLKADGSAAWLRTNKIPLHDASNNVVGVLCSYEDITEQKQAESALRQAREEADAANMAKSEFLSRMSHELRTPLNAILGFGQVLDKHVLSPVAKESVGYILKGGRHLLDLINEVLDISRVESGHLELSLEPIGLDDIVPEACALTRTLAIERNISLTENTSDVRGIYVIADRQRLKQVLINLLANAIKYNVEGGQVHIHCETESDGQTSIAIRDTGPGISPQNMKKLFTPFERLGASATEVEGTGLGLVLSQRLVTAMGGTLNVESVLGQGATFTIHLPQTASPIQEIEKATELTRNVTQLEPKENIYKVLCIEDNPSNLRLLQVVLRDRSDIVLLEAIQGSIGLDLARQHEPNLILLDLNLPDINGREVLAKLQQSALTRDIPVIVVSADATANQIEKLLKEGAKAYLTKPLDVTIFLETLDLFLQTEVT